MKRKTKDIFGWGLLKVIKKENTGINIIIISIEIL